MSTIEKGFILLLFSLLLNSTAYTQRVNLGIGYTLNRFIGPSSEGHDHYEFKGGNGFTALIALDSLKYEWSKFSLTIQYDHYKGEFDAYTGGLGSGYGAKGKIERNTISICLYPIVIRKLIPKAQIGLGLVTSIAISENLEGRWRKWDISPSSSSGDISNDMSYAADILFGLQGFVNYRIPLKEKWSIAPQYQFYYGLSGELKRFPTSMGSLRHGLLMVLQYKLE